MAPRASVHECGPVSQELAEFRLLTEVHKLRAQLDEEGNVPLEIEQGVRQNLQTAVAEISMPYAVTTTVHRVEYHEDEKGRPKRVITWLGKNAVEVAMGGEAFHFSPEARKRVSIEIDEAKHAEEHLHEGRAAVFISPKMSAYDAPLEIARAEHLADEDSIRVSTPVCIDDGTVVARRMQSLLVTDIPLTAWAAMLQDPSNIFGKAFILRNEHSALSVMELFSQLELPAADLPDGPVTLVEAVIPYLHDDLSRKKVAQQVERFRKDQKLYSDEATRKSDEWYRFDLELARSLAQHVSSFEIKRFITVLQHEWDERELEVLEAHSLEDATYRMTEELAAMLEKKKRLLLGRTAAVVTNNDRALKNVPEHEKEQILRQHYAILEAEKQGISMQQIRLMQAAMERQVARTDIKVGGGCAGGTQYENDRLTALNLGRTESDGSGAPESAENNRGNWKWKRGVCQVRACPSPKPTEVGPCSVCRRCQNEFDRGHDPTKAGTPARTKTAKPSGNIALSTAFGANKTNKKTPRFPQTLEIMR